MFVDIVHKELKGSKIWFFTNGDLLTPEKAKIFFKKGVDLIIVSQHDKKPSPQISLLKSFDWNGKMKFVDVTETSHLLTNRGGLVDIETLHPMYCPIGCLIIRYDGTVVFCCNDYYNEVTFGNVKNKSVKEIWNNPRYREIRKNVLKRGKFDFDICKKCLGIT
jgi:radical SAM protein with 4Fe4S-binding SPASM domain